MGRLTLNHSNPALFLADAPHRTRTVSLWAIAIFASLSLAMAWFSKGFLEGDAVTHYIYQRHCFEEHWIMTDVWGRPFCTLGYALAAIFGGRFGARAQMMLTAVATALITLRIARNQGYRHPALALVFLLGQPLVFVHSFSTLTELPFALLLALALWAYQRRQWLAMALVVGLMPTARPEGFVIILMAAFALLLHRRWWWIPILLLPLALWSLAGAFNTGVPQPWLHFWRWLPDHWPYAPQSLYGRGYILFFPFMLPAIISPFVFPALGIGVWSSLRLIHPLHFRRPGDAGKLLIQSFRTFFGPDHRLRIQWLIALLPLGVLAGHSVLYWLGKMASNGELRYMSVVAPLWALLAARGWEEIFDRLAWRPVYLWAGVAVLLPILANVVYPVLPLKYDKTALRAREFVDWYRHDFPMRDRYPRVMATPREVYFFLDISPTSPRRSAVWQTDPAHPPALDDGIVMIWDPVYGLFNSDASRRLPLEEVLQAGWIPVRIMDVQPGEKPEDTAINRFARRIQKNDLLDWVIFLSPRDKEGRPTDRSLAVPLPPAERLHIIK